MRHLSIPNKHSLRIPLVLTILLATLLLSSPQAAAINTYYLATNGSDSNPGSSSQPWATFGKAWTVLAPGDTLIVKSGRYYSSINPPISGAPGSPITIKSEVDGGAVIDGGGTRVGISIYTTPPNTIHHIVVEGFRVENCGERPAVQVASKDGTAIIDQTNNIVIRRTGARGDATSTDHAVWSIERMRDSLFEDVWGWGKGRYVILVYGGTNITVRRGVFRWDGWGEGTSPKFGMGVYNTHDSLVENVLLLDAASTSVGGEKGGLYVPGNSNGATAPYTNSSDNTFRSVISLNNAGYGLSVEGGSGGSNTNNRFVDVVVWGNSRHGVTVPKKASGTSFEHVTVGDNQDGFYFGDSGHGVSGSALRNSLVHFNSSGGIDGPVTLSHNNVFGNGTDYQGGSSPDPNSTSLDPLLDYILRLEADSPCKGTASDGGDRGATVLKRSVDGTQATVSLWPWPYENRIRTDLCESVTRGFCDPSWASLTEYVWEQLGNPWPPPGDDDIPPSVPTNPLLTEPTSSALRFSWVASTDNVAVTGYWIDVSTDSSFTSFIPGYNSRDVGNVIDTVITGLQPETVYFARVRAHDAAGNTSDSSGVISESTLSGLQTTTFQQGLGGYTGVTDTWINYYDPNLNFNQETKLNVHGTEGIKVLVRFDLSSIPAGARITSATLSLYNYAHNTSANGGTLSVHPANRPWIDSQATWNQYATGRLWAAPGMQAGTDYLTSPVTSITIDTTSGVWRDFDVTAIVQNWLDGGQSNHGFVVLSPTRGVKPLFYSSGYSTNPGLRPRLTVTF